MTTTMEENEMNEFNQIRERFLADTRQHFQCAQTLSGGNSRSVAPTRTPCRAGTGDASSRQTSA
jgi:hypothetical protein